jgi:hypothetical protein
MQHTEDRGAQVGARALQRSGIGLTVGREGARARGAAVVGEQ